MLSFNVCKNKLQNFVSMVIKYRHKEEGLFTIRPWWPKRFRILKHALGLIQLSLNNDEDDVACIPR